MTGEKGGLLAGLRTEALKWPPSRSPCAGPDESGPHTGIPRNQTLPG